MTCGQASTSGGAAEPAIAWVKSQVPDLKAGRRRLAHGSLPALSPEARRAGAV